MKIYSYDILNIAHTLPFVNKKKRAKKSRVLLFLFNVN